MRILAAEDDVTSRMVLTGALEKWGYDVVSASDGNEAWRILEGEDAPSLAILDWMMPGLDGPDVCRRVRQEARTPPIYIILLTARERKEDIVTGLDAGANDYVTKPFDKNELHARLRVGQRVVELQASLSEQIDKLKEALTHIRTLQGLLPICMHCHKIRTDQTDWQRMEKYVEAHSEATFSHSICPDCLNKHYPAGDKGERAETDRP